MANNKIQDVTPTPLPVCKPCLNGDNVIPPWFHGAFGGYFMPALSSMPSNIFEHDDWNLSARLSEEEGDAIFWMGLVYFGLPDAAEDGSCGGIDVSTSEGFTQWSNTWGDANGWLEVACCPHDGQLEVDGEVSGAGDDNLLAPKFPVDAYDTGLLVCQKTCKPCWDTDNDQPPAVADQMAVVEGLPWWAYVVGIDPDIENGPDVRAVAKWTASYGPNGKIDHYWIVADVPCPSDSGYDLEGGSPTNETDFTQTVTEILVGLGVYCATASSQGETTASVDAESIDASETQAVWKMIEGDWVLTHCSNDDPPCCPMTAADQILVSDSCVTGDPHVTTFFGEKYDM